MFCLNKQLDPTTLQESGRASTDYGFTNNTRRARRIAPFSPAPAARTTASCSRRLPLARSRASADRPARLALSPCFLGPELRTSEGVAGRAEGGAGCRPSATGHCPRPPLAMARLPSSAGQGQSHRGHRSGRAWGSWPPLPGWGLGDSLAKQWRRPQNAATMATVVVLVFLFSAGIKGDEGVPAAAGVIRGEGISACVHGKGVD